MPRSTAPLRSGEPLSGPVEFSYGATSLASTRDPHLVDDQAAVEVPERQLRGELRIRLGERGELALFEEHGIQPKALDDTQAPIERGTVWGAGGALRYSIALRDIPGMSIGAGFELMRWSIPYVEYRTCIENCEYSPGMQVLHGSAGALSPAVAVTPTYRVGPVALFAGMYVRRHPTIVRKDEEEFTESGDRIDSDVDAGPVNYIAHVGAEYHYENVALLVSVQQELVRDPVSYGPSVAVGLALTLPNQ